MTPTASPLEFAIDDYDLEGFLAVAAAFGQDGYGYVVTPNVDHLIRWHDSAGFRRSYADAAFILLDSRLLSNLFRWTKGIRTRVCTGSDLTAHLLQDVVASDDPLVLIGGHDSQAQALIARYGLRNLRHMNPPMGFADDPAAVAACIDFIESCSPFRFCLLAVGAPRQEMLAQELRRRGRARGLALCVGASIDFLTGKERRAPRWMQRLGLEWLFRLVQSPSRLAHRYLVRGPRVLRLLPETRLVLRPCADPVGTPCNAPLQAG